MFRPSRIFISISKLFLLSFSAVAICGTHKLNCDKKLTVPDGRVGVPKVTRWIIDELTAYALTYERAEELARFILNQPPKQQKKWIEAIAAAYPVVANIIRPPPGSRVSEKRLLDRLLLWVQKLDEKFLALKRDVGSEAAFRKVLADQTALFNTICTEADILLIIERFQHIVSDWKRTHPTHDGKVVLGGSFLNGKWRPGSDIDISMNGIGPFEKALIEKLKVAAASGLSPGCNPPVQAHTERAIYYGMMNPFAMEISAAGTHVFLFKPTFSGERYTLRDSTYQTVDW